MLNGSVDIETSPSGREATAWLSRLVAAHSVGLVIVLAYSFVALSYFNVPVNAALSWFPVDPAPVPGHLSQYAVGQHYFGDFLLPYQWGKVGNPWTDYPLYPNTYMPALNLIFKLFALLPYHASLGTYLALSALAMMSPFIVLSRGLRVSFTIIVCCLLCLMTYPFLHNLDRGNSQAMLVPLFLGLALALSRHRWGWAAGCIFALGLLKGYPIVLLLLLVGYKKFRVVTITIVGFALANIGLLAVFPGSFSNTVTGFRSGLESFTPHHTEALRATNYSLTGCIMNAFELIGHPNARIALWLASHPWVPGIAYIVVITPIVVAPRFVPLWVRLFVAFSATQLVVPISHGYTTVYMLVIAAFFVAGAATEASPSRASPKEAETLSVTGPLALRWTAIIAVVLTLLPAPWSINDAHSSLSTIYGPLAILAFVAVVYTVSIQSYLGRR